ncbi:hypothetical protein B0H11DRAFT_2249145 [Mycena galericulata]|nr:hypothetical protein B0H11DRAFT_2249145 [Mycena galericulata]
MLIGGCMDCIHITTPNGLTELLDIFQKHGHSEVDTAAAGPRTTAQILQATVGLQERGLKVSTKLFPSKGTGAVV